jgi:hypothetical protein
LRRGDELVEGGQSSVGQRDAAGGELGDYRLLAACVEAPAAEAAGVDRLADLGAANRSTRFPPF